MIAAGGPTGSPVSRSWAMLLHTGTGPVLPSTYSKERAVTSLAMTKDKGSLTAGGSVSPSTLVMLLISWRANPPTPPLSSGETNQYVIRRRSLTGGNEVGSRPSLSRARISFGTRVVVMISRVESPSMPKLYDMIVPSVVDVSLGSVELLDELL